ncbi:hypothetical protein BU24DRAFT_171779 [Aaosphaeria arxii CBS 175.79]|uniref:Integral membrane protein n=1 Tax=Aaosphaeria arxii CBS 175.79 TaxID=1450172 RepID=A0A6A5Y0Z8_9PLEO|nr:uncharacterized protein BU24DRAFT_171779 [Aaosphaeria arxii CBS 175.79]KAF2018480.1 hypothetical protein BU24DRAFT_171779 [Aaosphaeria arxii CBS 175.79]
MDKLKSKARTARNTVAERASRGTGTASLSAPHEGLPPQDNASTTAVNEGILGPQTAARDFAAGDDQPVPQPRIEPPTSLQSSVDAGKPVPKPLPRPPNPESYSSYSRQNLSPPQDATIIPGRQRSTSAPQRNLLAPPTRPSMRPNTSMRQSSIAIRRMPSHAELRQQLEADKEAATAANNQLRTPGEKLAPLDEDCALALNDAQAHPLPPTPTPTPGDGQTPGFFRRASQTIQQRFGMGSTGSEDRQFVEPTGTHVTTPLPQNVYRSDIVDVLDTIDPEVQTLTSLTNVQNSLFVPNLGRFVNRRPTYTLRPAPSEVQSLEDINTILEPARAAQAEEQQAQQAAPSLVRSQTGATMTTLNTIDSHLSDSRYAVLPHGTSLEGWTREEKQELNDHVRHMLHSRRSKFKRSMRGFGQYVRRPLGFAVTLYATLITLFGLAWVLFLIGWVNVGGHQIYVIHIIDSVLVALFAIVGDGLAPFRAVDTYHMIYIAHYHHYTWSRRKKDLLPELHDHNDLPSNNAPMTRRRDSDTEDPEKQLEFTVLTPKQQAKLEHHQAKFCKSHSFYKPHETETHYAFPLRLLVAIVVLLDCHSLLQISLGACTWGIYYKHRPFAITTVILCVSITCNATAGLLILLGDKKTRKKDVLERMNRQELTEEAMRHIAKKKERESESEREEEEGKGRRSLDIFRRHGGPSKVSSKTEDKNGKVEAYP